MSSAPRPRTAKTAPAAAEGFAERGGDLGLGAAGGDAVVEVGLIVGDDVVGGRGRQADEAFLQTIDEFGARH